MAVRKAAKVMPLLLQQLLLAIAIAMAEKELPEITPFEAMAMGDMPTCCPESPLRYCDFYFDQYEHVLPSFHLRDGVSVDHPLSTVSRKSFNWKGWLGNFSPSIKDSKTGRLVYVSSSWKNGTLLQCPHPLPATVNAGNQFFITGDPNTGFAKLNARAFQRATEEQQGREFYEGRCVLLPLTRVLIPTDNGDIELEHMDGKTEYLERRRCVVFKTKP